MFGIKQDRLIKNLEKIQTHLCDYSYFGERRSMCDCKYIPEKDIKDAREVEGFGCPEVRMCIELIKRISPEEFEIIFQRCKYL